MDFFGDSPFTKSEVFHSPPYNRVLPSSSSLRRESTKDVVASESTSELSSVDCVFSLMGSAFSHTGLSIMAKTSDMREGPRSRVKEFMESEGLMESEHGKDGIAVSVSEPLWISGGQAEGELPWAGRSVRDSLGKVTKPDSKPYKHVEFSGVLGGLGKSTFTGQPLGESTSSRGREMAFLMIGEMGGG